MSTEAQPALVYVDPCPVCGEGIPDPFVAGIGPVPFVHRRSHHRNCRLIVWPSSNGSSPRAYEVPENVSLEDAVTAAVRALNRFVAGCMDSVIQDALRSAAA